MDVFSSYEDLPEAARGLSVALGNFDGLHLGHMAVVDTARTAGEHGGQGWALATFEPPPRAFFQPGIAPFRLILPHRRAELARAAGARAVFELPFNAMMAAMSDADFVTRVLHEGLGARHVSVGADYRFGKGRMGDAASLARHALGLGIGVSIVEPVGEEAEKISSSAIRAALRAGEPRKAAGWLGRWWVAEGVVEHGEKRGRTIGFPTANVRLGALVAPGHGIYAVMTRLQGETGWRPGVANFGRTPTTGLRDPLLEVFLFDFAGDLYGQWIEVALIDYLRPEERFDSLDALVGQMQRDAALARERLGVGDRAASMPSLPHI